MGPFCGTTMTLHHRLAQPAVGNGAFAPWPRPSLSPPSFSPWLLIPGALLGLGLPLMLAQALRRRTPPSPRKATGMRAAVRVSLRLVLPLRERRRSCCLLLLLFLSLALANCAAVAQSFAQRDYMTALSARDGQLFFRRLGLAMALLAITMPARSLAEFAAGGLAQVWRDTLTHEMLREYFHPKVVYWLRRMSDVPDPDMRIAVEAGHFTDMLVLLVRDIFENILMKLCGFLGVVFSISPPLCGIMGAYAGLGAVCTVRLFGAPLVQLDRSIRSQEAYFRQSIARCLDRSEALCLCGGEGSEGVEALSRYRDLRRQQWARVFWRTSLGTFRECFTWAAYLLPVAVVAPLWLKGQVPFGAVPQAVMAFQAESKSGVVSLGALTVVVRKFRSVSALMAEGTRLDGLHKALEAAKESADHPSPRPQEIKDAGLDVQDLELFLPDGTPLYQAGFHLSPGQRLAIFGPSGVGKTTLVRALAGLWASGKGAVRRPPAVFLPQEPYIPEGTLRRVLSFPHEGRFTDEEVLEAAHRARLEEVLGRLTLDSNKDWEAVLSRGERQRCAFCRLLLLRPQLAVLDEATSALDEATEAALYQELTALPSSLVSVSHRPGLSRFHTHSLRHSSEGPAWTFQEEP
ncbi:unnamed protein product [Effrenium voratum]|nr:unnamed protein product [Effrenium voratum]